MVLNSSRLIPALCSRYCGMALYFSNSACHADVSSGGTTPVTGFHSTIDRPDSVSRVAPPTTTVANIRAATASSHSRTARRRVSVDGARLVMGSFVCRQRGCKVALRGCSGLAKDLQFQQPHVTHEFANVPSIATFAREHAARAYKLRHRDTSAADHIVAQPFPQLSEKHAHPPAQARRCGPADRFGGGVGAPRDGVRTIAAGQGQRRDRGDLLRGRRTRLGAAGDAAHSLDVAARPHLILRRSRHHRSRLVPGAKRSVRSFNWSMYLVRNN